MSISVLAAQMQSVMEKLSNGDELEVSDEVIDRAVEEFRECLVKQLRRDPNDAFRLRMSNIGRPVCQLQMQKSGATPSRRPPNHIIRMMIGDAVEIYTTLILRLANANITGGKDQVEFDIAGTTIRGESDIDLDDAVWDVKSCSPWAYKNKWAKGWAGLRESDDFGYIGQLYGYSRGQGKKMGGWVVVDKSSGEVSFVEAQATPEEELEIKSGLENTISKVESDAPFERCFEAEEEFFNRKPTGNKRLPMNCSFCDYKATCWPDSVYKPQAMSKAQNPRYYWYAEFNDNEDH